MQFFGEMQDLGYFITPASRIDGSGGNRAERDLVPRVRVQKKNGNPPNSAS